MSVLSNAMIVRDFDCRMPPVALSRPRSGFLPSRFAVTLCVERVSDRDDAAAWT
jgi:hypothetical protein